MAAPGSGSLQHLGSRQRWTPQSRLLLVQRRQRIHARMRRPRWTSVAPTPTPGSVAHAPGSFRTAHASLQKGQTARGAQKRAGPWVLTSRSSTRKPGSRTAASFGRMGTSGSQSRMKPRQSQGRPQRRPLLVLRTMSRGLQRPQKRAAGGTMAASGAVRLRPARRPRERHKTAMRSGRPTTPVRRAMRKTRLPKPPGASTAPQQRPRASWCRTRRRRRRDGEISRRFSPGTRGRTSCPA
mmetsp:Transcript_44355/g.132405  ORF Transcript_44355/g.132405 Transcript_44355/m.132405 type:complete len:239 (-) Transcript_44355:627-1343(-)